MSAISLDKRSEYLPSLDGLRAVAILIVMSSHLVSPKMFPGQFGVTLFFFISGFIITRNLLGHDFAAPALPYFYLRRLFRLTPALIVYIFIANAIVHALGGHLPSDDMLASMFYFANYHDYSKDTLPGVSLSTLEMTWSLAVEEHFYLLFPALILVTSTAYRLLACSGAIALGVLLWRVHLFRSGTAEWSLYAHTDARLDSILYGCMLSTAIHMSRQDGRVSRVLDVLSTKAAAASGIAVLALSFLIRDETFRATIRYFVQALGLVPIFCLLFRTPRDFLGLKKLLSCNAATFIGRLSYSLYLYHVICWFAILTLGLSHVATAALTFISAFAAAFLSYSFVEKPGIRCGSRLIRFAQTTLGRQAPGHR